MHMCGSIQMEKWGGFNLSAAFLTVVPVCVRIVIVTFLLVEHVVDFITVVWHATTRACMRIRAPRPVVVLPNNRSAGRAVHALAAHSVRFCDDFIMLDGFARKPAELADSVGHAGREMPAFLLFAAVLAHTPVFVSLGLAIAPVVANVFPIIRCAAHSALVWRRTESIVLTLVDNCSAVSTEEAVHITVDFIIAFIVVKDGIPIVRYAAHRADVWLFTKGIVRFLTEHFPTILTVILMNISLVDECAVPVMNDLVSHIRRTANSTYARIRAHRVMLALLEQFAALQAVQPVYIAIDVILAAPVVATLAGFARSPADLAHVGILGIGPVFFLVHVFSADRAMDPVVHLVVFIGLVPAMADVVPAIRSAAYVAYRGITAGRLVLEFLRCFPAVRANLPVPVFAIAVFASPIVVNL